MCVFLSLRLNKAQIKKQFDLRGVEEELFGPNFVQSAFEFQTWPVIACDQPKTLQLMNWGLIPRWVKEEANALKIRSNTVNARVETAHEKPSFRESLKKRRCLILADGFYEFRELSKAKYPYFIQLKGARAFALAGLYDEWANPVTGELLRTFALLTTEANSLMQKIHNRKKRMPVILPAGSENSWLDFTLKATEVANPFPDEKMEAWTVSRILTSRTEERNVPEACKPFDYPELVLADGLNI